MVIITINHKQYNFLTKKENNETIYYLPRLTDINKHGKNCFWEILVQDNMIFRKSYQEGGKIREFPEIVCTGKNIGRSNETTDHEQALFESFSLWTKKQSTGYSVENSQSTGQGSTMPSSQSIAQSIAKGSANGSAKGSAKGSDLTQETHLPMLANKYLDKKHNLLNQDITQFAISKKLDGVRVVAKMDKMNNIHLYSRTGKPFSHLNRLRESLQLLIRDNPKIIIDGELYSHELPFNAISGAVRAKKSPSRHDDVIQLWIFDLIDMSNNNRQQMSYQDRMYFLKELEQKYNLSSGSDNLKFVYYELGSNDEDVMKFHDQYVAEGFEGVMCRNVMAPYEFKVRSNNLLKFKSFEDSEFAIIGAKPGSGTERGAIVFECTTDAGVFDVRPRGSIELRREMFKNKEKYIGKMLTVRYQATGDQSQESGIPRFPVGIDVRDYE